MNAPAPTINERLDHLTVEYGSGLIGTRTREDRLADTFLRVQRKLRILQRSHSNDEELPSEFAVRMAMEILSVLRELEFPPEQVVTSAEGGIAFCFNRGNRYADIEVLNSEEIVAVISNRRDQPIVWTVGQSRQDIAQTLVKIRDYFRFRGA